MWQQVVSGLHFAIRPWRSLRPSSVGYALSIDTTEAWIDSPDMPGCEIAARELGQVIRLRVEDWIKKA